jgi:SAM-dependent methyltransferase
MSDPVEPETFNKLRRSVDAAFAMVAGIQLDVFTQLKNGPMTAEQIGQAVSAGTGRLRLLLYSLVSAGLLTEQHGAFSNTPEAQKFLMRDSPSSLGNRVPAMVMRWSQYFKTAESIRTGKPQAKVDFYSAPPQELEIYLRNINANTVRSARSLVEREDFSSVKTLLDVACGGAGIALTITKACPHIKATAIDLPQIVPIAEKIANAESATDRVEVRSVDVLGGAVPGSYDAAVLRAFIQVLSPGDARKAITNVGAAVKPGGRIFIIGQILDESRTSPLDAVGFNLTFLNTFDAGESYTEKEYREWLGEAGFIDISRDSSPLPDGSGLMTARKSV